MADLGVDGIGDGQEDMSRMAKELLCSAERLPSADTLTWVVGRQKRRGGGMKSTIPQLKPSRLLRGAIVNRAYGIHENLCT